MKAAELMIGDWVIVYEKAMPVKARVEGVFGRGAMVLGHVRSTDHGFMEPIPLTQEILEKNGFEKEIVSGDTYFTLDDIVLQNDYEFGFDFGRFYRDSEDGFVFVDTIAIKYVHQLQCALRLCGNEKEIEL